MTLIGRAPPRTARRVRGRRARRGARAARCRSGSANRRPGGGAAASASSSAAASAGTTWRRSTGTPAYLKRSGELGRARPGAGDAAQLAGQDLEVGVPHPRDVAAVGGAVVEDRQHVELAGLERQRAQDLVRARRVLDQQDRQLGGADPRPSRRARTRPSRRRGRRTTCSSATPEPEAQRRRPERVVDVVQAGERQLDRRRPRRGAQPEARRRACHRRRDLLRGDCGRRALAARSPGSGRRRGGRGRSAS